MKSHWIAGSIKHPGALRRTLHVKKGHKISADALSKAAHGHGITAKRAREAITLRRLARHSH